MIEKSRSRLTEATPTDKTDIEEQIETNLRTFEELEKKCYLPIWVCRDCEEECEPRSPFTLYTGYPPLWIPAVHRVPT